MALFVFTFHIDVVVVDEVTHFLLVDEFIHDYNSPTLSEGDTCMLLWFANSFMAFLYLRGSDVSFIFLNVPVIRPWMYLSLIHDGGF